MQAKADAQDGKTCPICGAPRSEKYRPFCSRRCADVDLNRWLSGRYAVPAIEADDADLGGPPDMVIGEVGTDGGRSE